MKTHIVAFRNTKQARAPMLPLSRSAFRYVAAVPLLLASLFAEPFAKNKRLPLRKPSSVSPRKDEHEDCVD